MKATVITILATAAITGIGGYLAYPYFGAAADPDTPFISACETAIKTRLKAPSTYKRLNEPSVTVTKISPDKAMATHDLSGLANQWQIDQVKDAYADLGAYRHRAIIRYESANAYGTPMANVSTCEVIEFGEGPPDLQSGQVLIDGQTNTDWLISGMRGLAQ